MSWCSTLVEDAEETYDVAKRGWNVAMTAGRIDASVEKCRHYSTDEFSHRVYNLALFLSTRRELGERESSNRWIQPLCH